MVHTHNHGLSSAEEVVTEVVNSHTQSRSRFKMATPSTVSVTLSSLMKKYQLKEEDLDKQVTDEHLDDIASSHCTKWRSLPSRLGMESIVVNDIIHTFTKEEDRRNAFFYKWKDIKGSAATYRKLIEALLGIKCREDAEGVCKLTLLRETPTATEGMLVERIVLHYETKKDYTAV